MATVPRLNHLVPNTGFYVCSCFKLGSSTSNLDLRVSGILFPGYKILLDRGRENGMGESEIRGLPKSWDENTLYYRRSSFRSKSMIFFL